MRHRVSLCCAPQRLVQKRAPHRVQLYGPLKPHTLQCGRPGSTAGPADARRYARAGLTSATRAAVAANTAGDGPPAPPTAAAGTLGGASSAAILPEAFAPNTTALALARSTLPVAGSAAAVTRSSSDATVSASDRTRARFSVNFFMDCADAALEPFCPGSKPLPAMPARDFFSVPSSST